MRRTHLGVQAAIVLTMVSFVSWPQFRPVRAQSVWRYAPQAVLEARTNDAARFAGDATARRGMALNQTALTTRQTTQNPFGTAPAFFTPSDVAAAGGKVNALVGSARTSLNMPIPYARVLLRNIRTGLVLAQTVANQDGSFSFLDLDSSAYIVELVGADGSVVATSQMVTMARGAMQQTVVRSAAAASAINAAVGNTLGPTAPQATTVASGSDVTRTSPAQTTAISPR